MTETEKKLQALVGARLKIDPAQVPLDEPITAGIGLDSFDLMSVILEIEEMFAPAAISDEAAQKFRTLRDVAAHIDSQLPRVTPDT